MLFVVNADDPERIALARVLFGEYAATPDVGVCLEDFATELSALPGMYSPPGGALLLAFDGEAPVGCVALRALEAPNIGEMKRLFVRPEARGRGVGAALVRALVERAREAGYAAVRLDTLPSMRAAQALYQQLGFRPIAPYTRWPIAGAVHLELTLGEAAS